MKAVCVMDSVSRANGGIFEAERKLQQSLAATGQIEIEVLALHDLDTISDREAWLPLKPITLPVTGPPAFGYSSGFSATLDQINADLAYSAGLWKAPSLAVLRWAARSRKPYLVAPHGMLDPWALRNSGLKKKIAALLFQNAHLRRAACLRALCRSEADSIRAYGLRNPICVIPNGIDLPADPPHPAQRPDVFPRDKKVLLYLGRLHPKKGLVSLLTAWKNARSQGHDWLLALAGWNQSGHEALLKQQAAALGLISSVLFLGPQFGPAKEALYRSCDAFILPSVSEGLPMVVLEAWAHAKPVLITPACNLPEGFAAGAALRIDPTPASLTDGLRHLFALSSADLHLVGQHGRALVQQRFAWPKLAAEMASVYAWILGRAERPPGIETM